MNRQVGAYIGGETVCLDCLTEEEKGKATEDASLNDWWIWDDEYFEGFLDMTINRTCGRCGKDLGSREQYERYRKDEVESRIAVTVYNSWKLLSGASSSYGLVVCLNCLTPQERGKPEQQEDRNYLTREDIERRVEYMPTEEGKKQIGSCGRCGKPFIELESSRSPS